MVCPTPRYSALKSLGEKKACFNEYQAQRKSEEVLERKLKLKKAREEFTVMLEQSKDLRASTSFRKAEALLEDDPRWKVTVIISLPPHPAVHSTDASS
jgi:pre-mRNA-processing factor 40